jgi:hypothetical protein
LQGMQALHRIQHDSEKEFWSQQEIPASSEVA